MTVAEVFSSHRCTLGEGPLWHPERQQLFWFDILGKRLITVEDTEDRIWQFEECVSAAGWLDHDALLIASETGLWRFDLRSQERDLICALEADNPLTRSNDGRADPWGGFWIGTMGFNAEPGAGAIYRFYRGELRKLVPHVTISNAICFAPDASCAYYADTKAGRIMRQPLAAADGWPEGEPDVFVDASGEDFGVDGAVVDRSGHLWNAQWGAGRVACYSPEGALLETVQVSTPQCSCPAFGGADLSTLFITTAAEGVDDPNAGQTYCALTGAIGQYEHKVIL
ncbi:SMP-30/gluconolactonase/LRE family protein [Epibacterium sp. Ofav1-8]|uniref:SMP-30/gluconolactonase/LRE family protein n=1 Tax=Epibacterium sp. Ofav1-8 TaxID=2917735 RepID=UPI001EF4FE03|nr:SMP-30/gluconolactonase/LRE family protein [Epibacterium sp. Ofav1-8]MCG7623825.1 SMP-30/gluconolactonase/LRE family protein [Epibacterium sp. Ofav1-8]